MMRSPLSVASMLLKRIKNDALGITGELGIVALVEMDPMANGNHLVQRAVIIYATVARKFDAPCFLPFSAHSV